MLDFSVFQRVLFIGPDYKHHRGGIGAVLEVYQQHIPGFRFIATHNSRLSRTGVFLLAIGALIKLCWKLCSNRHIQIVHIHGASRGSFYRKYAVFLIVRYIFRRKVVYHLHGGKFHTFYNNGSKLYRKCVRHLLEEATHVVCLSAYWEKFLTAHFKIKSVSIIHNPIAICGDRPNITTSSHHLSMLFLGKIGDNKGIFDLLAIIARNRDHYRRHITLKIGGNGDVNRLKKFIADRELEDIVEYAGWVHGPAKHHLLSTCDVLILPSYNEGLPISILEAMSYSKPIISTTVGGIPEIVKNGVNGFLTAPGDQHALEKHIHQLLYDTTLQQQMGKKSFEMVAPYRINNVLNEMQALYVNLINNTHHEPAIK